MAPAERDLQYRGGRRGLVFAPRQLRTRGPVAFDPFHEVRLAQRAVDQVRRDEWNADERSHTPQGKWIQDNSLRRPLIALVYLCYSGITIDVPR